MTAESTAAIRHGLDRARWSITDLWIASIGMGGAFTREEITHIADGTAAATSREHDILAAALNDHFTAEDHHHPVRYWRELAGR